MPLRELLPIVLLGAGIALGAGSAACAARQGSTGASSSSAAAQPARPSAPASASAAAPAQAAASDPAAPGGAAPEPPPASAEQIARLPPGAAIYASLRNDALDVAVQYVPQIAEILIEANRALGSQDPPDVTLAKAGVDPRRPILGAVVPASEKSARAVVDAMAKGASGKALEKVVLGHAGDVTRVRLLVPLVSGADPRRALAGVVDVLTGGAPLDACPGAARCAGFGARAPLGVAQGGIAAVAVYADGADLRLDVVMSLFGSGGDPAALKELVAFGEEVGGPEGRCSRFDASPVVSVCLDPERMGELGATDGYGKIARALSGGHVDPRVIPGIAAQGFAEARQNLWLAAPARRLASDGTLGVTVQGKRSRFVASWALTDASRAGVERAFAAERCAAGDAAVTELLPALRAAVGGPGKGFDDPKKVVTAFKEAGWSAYLIAAGGPWLNLLGVIAGVLEQGPGTDPDYHVCARYDGGRLVLVSEIRR
ncbi:hypothetical protein WME97_30065 [Sorangium sp. So ce367]|uniref:hypothetical protein n=1 Tax=Sorangium sp. So ce367 TaxID=3133305 RepID=UPI003F5E069F